MKNFILLTAIFYTLTVKAQTSQKGKTTADTSFKDITGNYKITTPILFDPHDDVGEFQVAIIPIESIGKKYINWSANVTPWSDCNANAKPFPQKDEIKFEKELLMCDSCVNTRWFKQRKEKTYCRRRGYGDHAAGSTYEVNYISFTKADHLIILAFFIRYSNCGGATDFDWCCKEEKRKEGRRDTIIDNVVNEMTFHKIQ